jgi:hypothetical protein
LLLQGLRPLRGLTPAFHLSPTPWAQNSACLWLAYGSTIADLTMLRCLLFADYANA